MLALTTIFLFFSVFCILRQVFVNCRSGYVNSVALDTKFHCDISKIKMYKASSELQCVHKCALFDDCHLLNFRVDGNEENNCEVFQLPENHKSCSMLKGEVNWKALVFQASCQYWSYNYCFPCKCQSNCSPTAAVCNCDSVPALPYIFISFDEKQNDTAIHYTRGMGKDGQSLVALKNGAKTGRTKGRIGNVLHLNGFDSGAVVGNFPSHALNNPNGGTSTFTFWMKIVSTPTTTQTIFGTGRKNDNTGILLQVSNNGNKLLAECIVSNSYESFQYDVGDTLLSWTHVAMVEYASSGPSMKLYLNGILQSRARAVVSKPANTGKFTKLVLGADDELFPYTNESYEIHIDDFAVWLTNLSDAEVAYVMKENYVNCLN